MDMGHIYLPVMSGAGVEDVVRGLKAVSHEQRFQEIRLRLGKRRCGTLPFFNF